MYMECELADSKASLVCLFICIHSLSELKFSECESGEALAATLVTRCFQSTNVISAVGQPWGTEAETLG